MGQVFYFAFSCFTVCLDFSLTDLSNKYVMEANGWDTDVQYSSSSDWNDDYGRICSTETFYGYKGGAPVGTVSVIFRGEGKATLNFGNCYDKGRVVVMLNDIELAAARASRPQEQITFYYKKDDVLLVKEVFEAIVKLHSLDLECGGM